MVFKGLRRVFVPPPARSAALMAAARGMPTMQGDQAARADKMNDVA